MLCCCWSETCVFCIMRCVEAEPDRSTARYLPRLGFPEHYSSECPMSSLHLLPRFHPRPRTLYLETCLLQVFHVSVCVWLVPRCYMSRFCSPQLFRQLTTLGEVSSRASSSHVLRAAKPSRLVASALHRSIAVRAHRRDYSTAFADHYFTEDSHADLEESDEPGPYTNMMKFPAKRAPRRTLIVRGFDPETTSLSEIKELMGGFGEITQMSAFRLSSPVSIKLM